MELKARIKRAIPPPARPLARALFNTLYERFSRTVVRPRNGRTHDTRSLTAGALHCSVSYNRYGGYCVPHSSRHRVAARRILANEIYEPQTLDFIRHHCAGGDIVHAGTYFGDFLPALSQMCDPAAQVWAFEPNYENYRCASITLALNDIRNVELINAGLGARHEASSVRVVDNDGRALGGGSRIIRCSPELVHQAVDILPLDAVVPPHRTVSVLQLDVEGYEQAVLTGALGLIRRHRPLLLLEVSATSTLLTSDWFSTHVLDLGYSEAARMHQNVAFRCDEVGRAASPAGCVDAAQPL